MPGGVKVVKPSHASAPPDATGLEEDRNVMVLGIRARPVAVLKGVLVRP
jgi:hypothetical protein